MVRRVQPIAYLMRPSSYDQYTCPDSTGKVLHTTRNSGLGGVFFSSVLKNDAINGLFRRFKLAPLNRDSTATFPTKRHYITDQ